MSLPRLTSLLMVTVVAAACDSDSIEPPFALGNAAATMECIGPLSESGVAIYLASSPVESLEPPLPYVRIIIRENMLERLSARTYVLTGSGADGAAWSFSTGTNPEVATSGTVTVNSVAPDNTIEGSADLTFPSGGRVGGNFQARWFPRVQLCL